MTVISGAKCHNVCSDHCALITRQAPNHYHPAKCRFGRSLESHQSLDPIFSLETNWSAAVTFFFLGYDSNLLRKVRFTLRDTVSNDLHDTRMNSSSPFLLLLCCSLRQIVKLSNCRPVVYRANGLTIKWKLLMINRSDCFNSAENTRSKFSGNWKSVRSGDRFRPVWLDLFGVAVFACSDWSSRSRSPYWRSVGSASALEEEDDSRCGRPSLAHKRTNCTSGSVSGSGSGGGGGGGWLRWRTTGETANKLIGRHFCAWL